MVTSTPLIFTSICTLAAIGVTLFLLAELRPKAEKRRKPCTQK